jgi:hypothetical protein
MGIMSPSIKFELASAPSRMGSDLTIGLKPEELDGKDRKFLRMNGLSEQQIAQLAGNARESARRHAAVPEHSPHRR